MHCEQCLVARDVDWFAERMKRKLYGVYVMFSDDTEPLGVENVLDFEDRAAVFFMVDADGNRWFLPLDKIRWIEVTPMSEL